MTVAASARAVGLRRSNSPMPSDQERSAANQLRRIIAARSDSGQNTTLKVSGEDGKPADVILTPGLSKLFMELLRHIGSGNAVTLVPITELLTTQQAADILNVSRPFLIQLLESGQIPFTLTGRHRRIQADDLFMYKSERDRQRADALSELAKADADLV